MNPLSFLSMSRALSIVLLASFLALSLSGCAVDCSARNTRASGSATLDGSSAFSRTLELTLTPTAYASADRVAMYRQTFLLLDVHATPALDASAPTGTFDVLLTSTRTDGSAPPSLVVTDVRDGLEVAPDTLFADCPTTGPCVRTIALAVRWRDTTHAATPVEWVARMPSFTCGDGAEVQIRDVTP